MDWIARIKIIGPLLLKVLVVVAGALITVYAFGPKVYDAYGISVRAAVVPAVNGSTVLEIPPVGSLRADTHTGPVELKLTVTGVRPDEIGLVLTTEGQPDILTEIQSRTQRPLVHFVLRQMLLGGLGAGLLYWAVFRPRIRRTLLSALAGLVLTGTVLGVTVQTYDPEAFREPEYLGVIAAAPRVLHMADELFDKLQDFQDKTDLVVRNMQALYGQVDRLDLMDKSGDRKVLVVSDIHNNFVALDFIGSLVHYFEVDMVLDAGDLTDFGSAVETQLVVQIAELGIPYIFVPGNHDSPEVMEFMRGLPNVVILDAQTITVDNLRILGAPDPWANGQTVVSVLPEEETLLMQTQTDRLWEAIDNARTGPDIMVTHNPLIGREFVGSVPLVVSGDTHVLSIEKQDETILVNPGSAGAAGFRGLQSDAEVPYTAVILHYAGEENQLLAADVITYHALSGSFTVERRLLADSPVSESTSSQGKVPMDAYLSSP